jgi:hypothetical protein
MAKAPPRTQTKAARARQRRTTKLPRATASSSAVAVETLREQADRLGLLDPLDAEPANVFPAVSPDGSET